MRKFRPMASLLVLIFMIVVASQSVFADQKNIDTGNINEENIYAPYSSFDELYEAYMIAIDEGDLVKQEELIELGWITLYKEEAMPTKNNMLRLDPDELDLIAKFTKYFDYGYFEERPSGLTLSLGNKLSYWSNSEKSEGWNSVYAKFHRDYRWSNTPMMKDQFYCHARLGYAAYEDEWNLEPWRTSMNPITCN